MFCREFPPRMFRIVLGALAVVSSLTATKASPALAATTSTDACSAAFSPISASAYVKAINPGWNLGNTLDAVPNEGSWNNPPVIASTFDDVKAAGFKSVRIPVTFGGYFITGSPSWTIDPVWLQRISDVVDMATARGLYVLTNVHHDSWQWADVTQSGANITMIQEKFSRLWLQLAETLACKSSMVALETINEPPANSAVDGDRINEFNDIFLSALAATGGYNSQRVVTLVGGGMDGAKTTQWFKTPSNLTNPWALQYHYYSPYDFIFGAWGKTVWGSDADKASLKTDLSIVRGNFTDVPIIIGEFDASPLNTEPAGRWKYFDFFTRTTAELNTAIMIWDNGLDHLDRNIHTWRDPVSISIIQNAIAGVNNSLADSTTDASATTQSSSAFIFNKVDSAVTDQTLPWLFNGNTLTSIQTTAGTTLSPTADYSVSSSAIAFTSAFLSEYLSPTATPGSKTNLTLVFSAGAPSNIEIVQWDVPILSATSSKAVAGSDLRIPLTYQGVHMVAGVKIVRNDGVYLFDDWTQWLPPLQQGRGTFNGQWNFDGAQVIITSAAVQAVISSGLPTTFTFEFYPRVPGNSVNYTLSP